MDGYGEKPRRTESQASELSRAGGWELEEIGAWDIFPSLREMFGSRDKPPL